MGTSTLITSVFLVLACLDVGAAPPASQPIAPADVNARAATLVAQGHAALRAGDAQAALENFLDARTLWNKQGIRTDINDPVMYADVCGIGISYLAMGVNERANEPLDRAYGSKLRERSLIINRAILDYIQHVNVQRGTKAMLDLLSAPDAPSDEPTINVLGACVQYSMLDPNLTRGKLFEQASQLYDKLNKELETKRPGERRWGPTWVTPKSFQINNSKLQAGKDAYQQALEERDATGAALTEANNELQVTIKHAGTRRTFYQQELVDKAQAKADKAADAFQSAKLDVPAKWKAIPWPQWPKSFPPMLPDVAGGGVFGAPQAPQPVVATIKPVVKPAPVAIAQIPKPEPTSIEKPPPTAVPPTPRAVSRYAVAVPVAADLLISAAAPLQGATDVMIEDSQGQVLKAKLVRSDAVAGLALLRVEGSQMRYVNLATSFTGGDVTCWGFPDVSIFNPVPDSIAGSAAAPKADKWVVSLRRNPRLAGGALFDKKGQLVGIELAQRDSVITQLPAVRVEDVRKFLGDDAPKSECGNPDPAAVWQVTASHDVQ